MKKMMRLLSMLICMALLISAEPADMLFFAANAEEFEGEPAPIAEVEPEPEPEPEPVVTEAPMPEPAEEQPEESTEQPEIPEETAEAQEPVETEAPADTPEPTKDPNAIDYAANAGESKAFNLGFAEVLQDDTAVYAKEDASADKKAALNKGVVYVVARSEGDPDRVQVVYNAGSKIGLDGGWVDAARVRPMEPEQEVPAYIAYCAEFDGIIYFMDSANLPLAKISCVYPEPEPEATAAPAQTEAAAVETPAPEATDHPVIAIPTVEAPEAGAETAPTEMPGNVPKVIALSDIDTIVLTPKMTYQLEYIADEGAVYAFTSNNMNSATVSETGGLITAGITGDAKITLSVNGEPQDTWTVQVIAASDVDLSSTSAKLGKGDTLDLSELISASSLRTPATYTYKVTSGGSYASVNATTGVITAKSAGTAVIRVTNNSGNFADFKVTVYNAATKLSTFSLAANTLGVGMTTKLTVGFPSKTYLDYTLESSDPLVATVAEDGTVTAVGEGPAELSFVPTNPNSKVTKTVKITVLPAPQSITLTASKASGVYGVNEKNAKVTANYGENAMCTFTYSSSNTDVAEVNESTGALTLKSTGPVVITAKASNSDATDSVALNVEKQPTAVEFEPSATLKLGKGDKYQLQEVADGGIIRLIPDGASASYTYKSGKPSVASISADGVITAKNVGTAKIRVYTQDTSIYKDLTVKVYYKPTKMKLSATALTMGVNMERKLTASFNKSTAYSWLSFSSDDPKVVSVDANGKLTSHGQTGKATITVTTYSKLKATCEVTVVDAPSSITLTASKDSRIYGVNEKNAKVTGGYSGNVMCDFVYKSSNESIAKVNESTGALTLLQEGPVTITATASNNSSATEKVELTVVPAPEKITFKPSATLKLGTGDKYPLTEVENGGIIQLEPDNASASYTYKSSKPKIVSVSATGVITAKKKGTAKIRVYSQNTKIYKDLTVKVYSAPSSVKITPSATKLGVKMTGTLKIAFNKSSVYSHYTLTSSNPDVLTVTQDGKMEAVGVGTATVTVTTLNKKTKTTALITVVDAPEWVEFSPNAHTISAGMTLALGNYVEIPSGTMASYNYTSDNTSVATVDSKGKVTGKAKGTANITVETQNGKTATATINVTAAPDRIVFEGMPATVKISKGDIITIPTPVAYAGNEVVPATYTFKTSKASLVKVSGNLMKGVKASTTAVTITATSHNKKTAKFKVLVYSNAVSGVKLAYSSYNLYIKDGYTDSVALNGTVTGTNLNFGSITYTSSDESVATVSASGVVTGVGIGTATITAKASKGNPVTCEITVGRLSSTLTIDENAIVLGETQTYKINPKFDPGTGSRITYKSSDPAKVTVDANGNLVALAPGKATITVEGQNGLVAKLDVTVLYRPTRISFPASVIYMSSGETVTLKANLEAKTSDMSQVKTDLVFSASGSAASVVDNGDNTYTVTAKAAGTMTMKATTYTGLTATCEIRVDDSSARLGFPTSWDDKGVSIVLGDTADLGLMLTTAALQNGYKVTSSNTKALSPDSDVQPQSVKAVAVADNVTLTLTVGGETVDTQSVQVVASAKPSFKVNSLSGFVDVSKAVDMDVPEYTAKFAKHDLQIVGMPKKPLIGTFEMSYDTAILKAYDWSKQYISTTEKTGTTTVHVKTYSGEAEIEVTVLEVPVYRALLFSEFDGTPTKNLPFASLNLEYMEKALRKSTIGGQKYSKITVLKNPTQAQLENGFISTFKDSKRNDVSVVYEVGHGYLSGSTFYLGTLNCSTKQPDTIFTDQELMGWLKGINGNVLFIMDNCASGQFIVHEKALKNLTDTGNIAVITAQNNTQTASYYINYKGIETHEFFTRAVYSALGNPLAAGDAWDSVGNADVEVGNKDNLVTINELFTYTSKMTKALVSRYATKTYFVAGKALGFTSPYLSTWSKVETWKKKAQVPQSFIPTAMKNLPIVGR